MLRRLCTEATGSAGLSTRSPFILRGNRRGRNTNVSHFQSANITIRLCLAALLYTFSTNITTEPSATAFCLEAGVFV